MTAVLCPSTRLALPESAHCSRAAFSTAHVTPLRVSHRLAYTALRPTPISNGGKLVAYRSVGALIDAFAQVLARLEVRHVLAVQCHSLPGLRVPPLTRRSEM